MAQSDALSSQHKLSDVDHGKGQTTFVGPLRHFARTSPIGAIGGLFLFVVALTAVFADQIAPYPPLQADYAATQQPPSSRHWLGTDHLGRDVWSRIVHGARITLLVSFSSVAIGCSVGIVWGLVSGYVGRGVDIASQRLIEVLMSFPTLILAMLLVVSLGSGLSTVVIAVGITQIPLATRITRSVVLSVKELPFVDAARCIGAPPRRLILLHIAPQCIAPMLVVATLNLGSAIFAEAGLSFLGVGIPPPNPSWGNMLGGVLAQAFRPPWWLVLFPGLAIVFTVLAANLLGDGLRDFFDPKLG